MIEQERLLKELARKYGISLQQARDIEDSLKFVATVMKDKVDRDTSFFPAVRVPFFGLFHCPERVLRHIKKLNEKK